MHIVQLSRKKLILPRKCIFFFLQSWQWQFKSMMLTLLNVNLLKEITWCKMLTRKIG